MFLVTWQRFCEHHPPSRRHLHLKRKKAYPDDDVKFAPAHFREFIGLKLDVPSRIGKGGVQIKCDLPRMRAEVVRVASVKRMLSGCLTLTGQNYQADTKQEVPLDNRPLELLDQWPRALYRVHGPQRIRSSLLPIFQTPTPFQGQRRGLGSGHASGRRSTCVTHARSPGWRDGGPDEPYMRYKTISIQDYHPSTKDARRGSPFSLARRRCCP